MLLMTLFGLIFGLICMTLGFYGGYLLADNKNLKSILDQYEVEDARYNLERMMDDE